MKTIITGSFDPISQKDLRALLVHRREHHLKDLYISVNQEGILPYETRCALLKKAIKPYRHLHFTEETGSEGISPFDEAEIRTGCFYLAARGIQKELLEKGCYFDLIVKAHCTEHRAAHSFSVASTAAKLARMHGCDEKTAYQAGLLHDITKAWSAEEHRAVLSVYAPQMMEYAEPVWHSFSAVFWLKEYMGLKDRKILRAIWHHTLGDGASVLDHILYIADKIEPNRHYDTAIYWRIAGKSLKAAAEKVHEDARQYILKTEGRHV